MVVVLSCDLRDLCRHFQSWHGVVPFFDGVDFMIKTSIARKLQNLPVDHSDRIMSLRLPIRDSKFATLLSVYAETGVKEAFYRDLHNLQQLDSRGKLLVLGDCNARVE